MDRRRELAARAAEALRELATLDPPDDGESAMAEITLLIGAVDSAEASLSGPVRTVHSCGVLRGRGFSSTSTWLRSAFGMRYGRAADRITLATQLPRLSRTASLFAAGELSSGRAHAICQAAKRLSDEELVAAEPELLELAGRASVEELSAAGLRMQAKTDPRDHGRRTEAQFDRRWMGIIDLPDGMGRLDGMLDPETKNRLRAALESLAQKSGPSDGRSYGQRLVDALAALVEGAHVGPSAQLSVVISIAALTGGQEPGVMADGTPIPAADARRLAADAGLSRVIVGPASMPLDVGRTTRLATPAMIRALRIRDGGCVVEGCVVPGRYCQADHVTPWIMDGKTSLDNLVLCCPFHNRFKQYHPSRVAIHRDSAGRVSYRVVLPEAAEAGTPERAAA